MSQKLEINQKALYKGFKQIYSIKERQDICQKIQKTYPDLIPVILELYENSKPLKHSKFIISKSLTLAEFQQTVKKKLQIQETQAMFLFINKKELKNLGRQLADIYKESYNKEDGFLYINYSDTDAFG